MNTSTRSWLFLVLLGGAVALLPACGNKNNVKTENPPETVLNPETTPISNGELPARSYVEKIHRTKGPKSTTSITTTPVTAGGVPTPVPTLVVATNPTPAMESPAPVKRRGGSHWLLWVLVALLLVLIGWYFWNKKQENRSPTQPTPPTGGLSPVSGFTAVKGRIEDEAKYKPSIWSKKIF